MDYYYRNNQQQEEGPLPEEILREWLKMGQINENTSVRRSDSHVWISAAAAFSATKSPAVLLTPSTVTPEEEVGSENILHSPKVRIIGGAAIALLLFIAYQKSQRNNVQISKAPVATQPQQPTQGAPQPQPISQNSNLEATHQTVRNGLVHLYGFKCLVNLDAANQCFCETVDQNDYCGAFWRIYMIKTYQKDFDQAKVAEVLENVIKECVQQADAGDSLAKLCVGVFFSGADDASLKKTGLQCLNELAQAGDPIAAYEYAAHLVGKDNTEEDKRQGFQVLKALSEDGTVRADFLLGACYVLGWGTEVDAAQGNRLIRRAAEKGDPDAISFLNNN